MGYIVHGNLSVDAELLSFINDTLLPSAGVEADRFWTGFDEAVHRLAPRNAELLQTREEMQSKIDSGWLTIVTARLMTLPILIFCAKSGMWLKMAKISSLLQKM